MKTKILLLVSVLLFSFSACKKSNDQENDSRTGQLTGVLSETIMSSQDVANSLSAQVLALTGFDIDLLPLAHEMKVAVITYSTTGVEGDIVDASGVIAYRTDVSEYDHIVSVQHGTCDIASAPSRLDSLPKQRQRLMKKSLSWPIISDMAAPKDRICCIRICIQRLPALLAPT